MVRVDAVGDLLKDAPAGLWLLLIAAGLWSGVFDAHVSQRLDRYGEAKVLRGVGFTYVSVGIVLWIASKFVG